MKQLTEDLELIKFDGVNATAVYVGGMTSLYPANVKWREKSKFLKNFEVLKLSEIAEQFPKLIITVVTEGPTHGEIYQYGNYSNGKWYQIGETGGYA